MHRELYTLIKKYQKTQLAGHHFYKTFEDKGLSISSTCIIAKSKQHQSEVYTQKITSLTKQVQTLTLDNTALQNENTRLTTTITQLKAEVELTKEQLNGVRSHASKEKLEASNTDSRQPNKTDDDFVTKNRYSSFKTTLSSSDEGTPKTSKPPEPDSILSKPSGQ